MKSYLYAVQDEQGRELVSAVVEVEKVSDVEAYVNEDGAVELHHKGLLLEGPEHVTPVSGKLTLHRWPADDKLAEPVSHPISWVEEA